MNLIDQIQRWYCCCCPKPYMEYRLMLFGLANAGKTTIVQNMQLKYGFFNADFRKVRRSFYDNESTQRTAREDIRRNIHEGILKLCNKVMETDSAYDFESVENQTLANDLTQMTTFDTTFPYAQIWNDKGIQRAYIHTNQREETQNLQYFMEHIDRICQQDYAPTDIDGLHVRKRTDNARTYRFSLSSEFFVCLVFCINC